MPKDHKAAIDTAVGTPPKTAENTVPERFQAEVDSSTTAAAHRVLLAADHPLFLAGMNHAFDATTAFEVVCATTAADAAVELAACLRPDIAILDLATRGKELNTVQRLSALAPSIRIIILVASVDEQALRAAAKAGLCACLSKSLTAGELRSATRAVARGERYVSPELAATVLRLAPKRAHGRSLAALTERERTILGLVGRGLTNQEIAQRLELAEKTVKHHLGKVMQKLGVRNRVEAALLAPPPRHRDR